MATQKTYSEKVEILNKSIQKYQPVMGDYALKLIPEEEGKIKQEKVDKIEYFLNKCEIYELMARLHSHEGIEGNEIERVKVLLKENDTLVETIGEGGYQTMKIGSNIDLYIDIFGRYDENYDIKSNVEHFENEPAIEEPQYDPSNDDAYNDDLYYEEVGADMNMDGYEPSDIDMSNIQEPVEMEGMVDMPVPEEPISTVDNPNDIKTLEGLLKEEVLKSENEVVEEEVIIEEPEEEQVEEVVEEEQVEEVEEEQVEEVEEVEIPTDLFHSEEELGVDDTEENIEIEIPAGAFEATAEEDIEITLEEQERFNNNRNFEEETLKDLQAIINKNKITLQRVGDKYMEEYNERKESGNLNQEEEKERMDELSLFFYKVECDISDTKQKIESKKDKEIYKSAKR